jgi:hypothetical protein
LPENWDDALAVIAKEFHFPASDLWAMDADDLEFWVKKANWLNGQR